MKSKMDIKELMDTTETQRIIRNYYKKLHANKMNNLEEMDKFFEKYNLPRLNQKEIENMNRPIIDTEIKTDFKTSNKSPGSYGFTADFYPIFRGKLIPILLKFFLKHSRGKRNTPKHIL